MHRLLIVLQYAVLICIVLALELAGIILFFVLRKDVSSFGVPLFLRGFNTHIYQQLVHLNNVP